jgi:chromosome segregation ATPase
MGSKNESVGDDSSSLIDGRLKPKKSERTFSNQEGALTIMTGGPTVKKKSWKPETFTGPQNSATDRLQSALKAQLVKTRDRIQRELRKDQDGLRQVKKNREDCGVELYGMQQQLALLQKKLDETEERHAHNIQERQGIDGRLIGLRDELKSQIAKKHDLVKKVSKRKDDLDAVESSLRQAQKFNQEAKKEVAITKRAASKAKETVKGAEKSKEAQDLYIDELNRQIQNLETELALVTEELILQEKETKESDAMIKDMSLELEDLSSEKKRLVQQWNSAIMALGRRDQVLTAAAKAVKKAQNAVKDNESELIGLKRDYFNLSTEKEKRQFDRSRIKNEVKVLDENVQQARSDQEMLASQIELISKIMTKTQEDCLSEERATKRHKSSAAILVHKIEGMSSERRALEER